MPAHTSKTSHSFFDFTSLPARERYKLLLSTIVPRPIAWIVTLDPEGRVNVAPFSFFKRLRNRSSDRGDRHRELRLWSAERHAAKHS